MSIKLTRQIMSAILTQAERTYPAKCFGFIVGKKEGGIATGSYYIACDEVDYIKEYPLSLTDSHTYNSIKNKAGAEGLTIVSMVHTHPDFTDEPSQLDCLYDCPGITHIIISLSHGKAVSCHAWQLANDKQNFIQEQIVQ
ncbi:Mov34/MPN/PAD-1 family protein [Spartinivicinus poritis]|uniref:Mov34/MPN/PAD-1 family protein n=1 Tax=Spartinivicinus poritis TaxID=2994640 RepID=A0ABT5UFI3_9GAMM|nr:Mov34/MPN/PAD-1 family protein [Spartinivicinus sp. A2-2]MDE1465146.1 Mov34/MPN/PAD-1 family protein [Spartinivicinus sp. A2-2]